MLSVRSRNSKKPIERAPAADAPRKERPRQEHRRRSLDHVAELEQSLRKDASSPTDTHDRAGLESLLARRRKQANFGQTLGIPLFGAMTVLSIVLFVTHQLSWFYTPVFVAFLALCIFQPILQHRVLAAKEAELHSSYAIEGLAPGAPVSTCRRGT